jgi:hypothetical protein
MSDFSKIFITGGIITEFAKNATAIFRRDE